MVNLQENQKTVATTTTATVTKKFGSSRQLRDWLDDSMTAQLYDIVFVDWTKNSVRAAGKPLEQFRQRPSQPQQPDDNDNGGSNATPPPSAPSSVADGDGEQLDPKKMWAAIQRLSARIAVLEKEGAAAKDKQCR